jgi:hypothetical protein
MALFYCVCECFMSSSPSESMTLRELLDLCCDRKSSRWEQGWRELLRRYKTYIYNCSIKNCSAWNVPRFKIQFSEAVDDVVSEVIFTMCKNDFQSLRNFIAKDQEPMFLAWLATVCRRATGHYIRKYFTDRLVDGDYEDLKQYIGYIPFDEKWELRESIISMIRSVWGDSRQNAERDILLFQLHVQSDFPLSLITSLPCLENVGPRVLDNVAHRMRKQLRVRRLE